MHLSYWEELTRRLNIVWKLARLTGRSATCKPKHLSSATSGDRITESGNHIEHSIYVESSFRSHRSLATNSAKQVRILISVSRCNELEISRTPCSRPMR